jgi:hypothetical protein
MFAGLGHPRWLAVRNDNSSAAPAFGVLRVTGATTVNGQAVVTVDKPNSTNAAIIINGPAEIAAGKFGSATFDPSYALYGTGTPAFGERWGPQSNDWTLKEGNPGCTIIGAETTGTGKRVLVQITPGETPSYCGINQPASSQGFSTGAPTAKFSGFFLSTSHHLPQSGDCEADNDRLEINADGDYEFDSEFTFTTTAGTRSASITWELYRNGSPMANERQTKMQLENPIYDDGNHFRVRVGLHNVLALVAGDYLEMYCSYAVNGDVIVTHAVSSVRRR